MITERLMRCTRNQQCGRVLELTSLLLITRSLPGKNIEQKDFPDISMNGVVI